MITITHYPGGTATYGWCRKRPSYSAYRHEYVTGELPPHYPMPVPEVVNALAMPMERISFYMKTQVLAFYENNLKP